MKAPVSIRLDAAARSLTLSWEDAGTQCVPYARLRAECRCASCTAQRRAGRSVVAAPDVAVLAVEPMGYGIRLLFSDGHSRGIYPWPFLARVEQADE